MLLHSKHFTAAIALMIGAGAYPIAAIAQAQTQADEVEGQASEAEERAGDFGETAGSALSDIGEAIGEAAEGTAEVIEQTVQETVEAVEAQINASDDLDDAQKQELEQAAAEGKPIPDPELIIEVSIGQKDVAIKWSEITITDEAIVIESTEEQLKNAPQFVSLEEQRMQAELEAQQEAAQPEAQQAPAEQDEGMLSTGTTGTTDQPGESEPEIRTTE